MSISIEKLQNQQIQTDGSLNHTMVNLSKRIL